MTANESFTWTNTESARAFGEGAARATFATSEQSVTFWNAVAEAFGSMTSEAKQAFGEGFAAVTEESKS